MQKLKWHHNNINLAKEHYYLYYPTYSILIFKITIDKWFWLIFDPSEPYRSYSIPSDKRIVKDMLDTNYSRDFYNNNCFIDTFYNRNKKLITNILKKEVIEWHNLYKDKCKSLEECKRESYDYFLQLHMQEYEKLKKFPLISKIEESI